MIGYKLNGGLGKVDFLPYIRRIALKEVYHDKRMDMLACTPKEYN